MGAQQVRGPGFKLRNSISDVRGLHDIVLEPSRARVKIPLSHNMDRKSGHMLLGKFYEELHAGLWGGKPTRHVTGDRYVPRMPDTIDEEGRAYSEVKGCFRESTCQLRNSQMDFYDKLQAAFPDWLLQLGVYRHSFPKIKSYRGSEQELIKNLAKYHTMYGMIISYDIAQSLHRRKPESLVRNYQQKKKTRPGTHRYETCTCIWSRTLNNLLFHPETVLEQAGLNPKQYQIDRLFSPEDFRIHGYKVSQFPMVRVMNKNYGEWAQRHTADYLKQVKGHDAKAYEIHRLQPFLRTCRPRTPWA